MLGAGVAAGEVVAVGRGMSVGLLVGSSVGADAELQAARRTLIKTANPQVRARGIICLLLLSLCRGCIMSQLDTPVKLGGHPPGHGALGVLREEAEESAALRIAG